MTVLWLAAALGTVSFALFLLLIGPVTLLPAWRASTSGFKKVMITVALVLTGTLGVVIWTYFLILLAIISD